MLSSFKERIIVFFVICAMATVIFTIILSIVLGQLYYDTCMHCVANCEQKYKLNVDDAMYHCGQNCIYEYGLTQCTKEYIQREEHAEGK